MQVQLAHKHNGENFINGLYSRKFDGKRMYVENGVAYSRQEKPCNVPPIAHILEQLPVINGVVWDGEVIYLDNNYNDDFKKTVSCTQAKNRKPDCDNLYYIIFDNANSNKPFIEEYTEIMQLLEAYPIAGRFDLLKTKYPNILIARQNGTLDSLQAMEQAKTFEGYMYRNGDAIYKHARTKSLLKIKAWLDGEFTIKAFEQGQGKYVDTLGAIVINYNGNTVNVGTGLLDGERAFIWANRSKLIGKRCKVKYFQEENKSLRFPVFLAILETDNTEIELGGNL